MPVFVKVPFSSSDLINWKKSAGSYRENPKKGYGIFQMIVLNHNPEWKDMQVLLNALLLPEERLLVVEKANKENRRINARERTELLCWNKKLPGI